jgi:hypothetical protein
MPNRSDVNTGIGWAGADLLSLIAGGHECIQCTSTYADFRSNRLTALGDPTDASDAVNKFYVDSSFGLYETKTNLDSSFGNIWTKFDYVDISLNNIESGSGISQAYVDGSISTAVNAVDTSLVTYTDAVIITALDSSFALYETKINLDTSLNDKANLNTVINVKEAAYTLVTADNNHVIDASGTWTLTFPDDLDTGFQVTAVNAGVGVITLDASKLLTKDSAVTIVDQYAGISAVHKGNGIYYCWGGLT